MHQVWRQDSVTGGAELNFGGHEKFIYVNLRGAQGHEKFITVWIKWRRWRPKNQRDFPAEIGNSSGFSGRKQVISKKKKVFIPKIRFQSTKFTKIPVWQTPVWASICTPAAPSLEISSGHSPCLGGTIFVGGAQAVIWGGTAPVCPPVAPGLTCTR